jgi:hypothetical protein
MRYFVIQFNDLSKEKQQEIKKALVGEAIKSEKIRASAEVFDNIVESIEVTIERACDKAWAELGVETTE